MFEIVYAGWTDDDGWTQDHEYPISSPMSFGSGELNNIKNILFHLVYLPLVVAVV